MGFPGFICSSDLSAALFDLSESETLRRTADKQALGLAWVYAAQEKADSPGDVALTDDGCVTIGKDGKKIPKSMHTEKRKQQFHNAEVIKSSQSGGSGSVAKHKLSNFQEVQNKRMAKTCPLCAPARSVQYVRCIEDRHASRCGSGNCFTFCKAGASAYWCPRCWCLICNICVNRRYEDL